MGIGEAFTEGRDEKEWAKFCLDEFRRIRFPELPTFEEFLEKNLGAWTRPADKPAIAFEDFRRDPEKYPLKTPSGRIEIFSKQLYDLNNPEEIPAIPKYIQEWESPFPSARAAEPRQPRRNLQVRLLRRLRRLAMTFTLCKPSDITRCTESTPRTTTTTGWRKHSRSVCS